MTENTSSLEVEQLRLQLDELNRQLAKVRAERDEYRTAAYAMLEKLHPFVPPTPEELHDLMHGPRGRSLLEIAAEVKQELADFPESPHGRG